VSIYLDLPIIGENSSISIYIRSQNQAASIIVVGAKGVTGIEERRRLHRERPAAFSYHACARQRRLR